MVQSAVHLKYGTLDINMNRMFHVFSLIHTDYVQQHRLLFTMGYSHKKGHRPHKRSILFPIKPHLEHDMTQSAG